MRLINSGLSRQVLGQLDRAFPGINRGSVPIPQYRFYGKVAAYAQGLVITEEQVGDAVDQFLESCRQGPREAHLELTRTLLGEIPLPFINMVLSDRKKGVVETSDSRAESFIEVIKLSLKANDPSPLARGRLTPKKARESLLKFLWEADPAYEYVASLAYQLLDAENWVGASRDPVVCGAVSLFRAV